MYYSMTFSDDTVDFDDILRYESLSSFPTPGNINKYYFDNSTFLTYRWDGSKYMQSSSPIKNTYYDWHLVPLSRPVINPPQQKTYIIDIPGANGSIDLSESITGYPIFENRTGTIEFAVLNDMEEWDYIFNKITKYFNGRKLRMIFDDDSDYYYVGRFSLAEWKSNNNGTWSTINLDYNLEPYKLFRQSSTDEWLWDSFNFVNGVISDTACSNIVINSTTTTKWIDLASLIGNKPLVPDIIVSDMTSQITSYLINTDLKYNNSSTGKKLTSGHNSFYDYVCCNTTENNDIRLGFKGVGKVSIDFRKGRI